MSAPFWARPRFVLAAVFAYLALHFAIRITMGQALSVDDSDQALFSQHYAWAYRYKAPPLFVWMLATLGQVMPVNAVATGLLHYSLLGMTFGFVYLAALRLLSDQRLSALCVYSFAAINTFAEASHRNLAHSTALAAFLALSWYVFVRLASAPRLGWYLVLGVVFGLGMLAKWNFAILALSLPLACLINRDSRHLVLTWKIVPAALITAAVVMPTFIATVRMGPPTDEDVRSVLQAEAGPGLAQVVDGTLKLLDTILIYSLPFLPIALIVFGLPLWRGLRAGAAGGWPHSPHPHAAVVGTTLAIGLLCFWALVLFLGATEFRVRYVYPAMLMLPVWLFIVVERGRPSNLAINIFALTMLALAISVGAKRALIQFTDVLSCGLCMEMRPYRELAVQLTEAGYQGGGTMLAGGTVAGNLHVTFPKARIIDPAYPLGGWAAPSGQGQCLLVWLGSDAEAREAVLTRYETYIVDALQGRPGAPHTDGMVSAPMLFPARGEFRLGYRLYPGPNGDCR